jgi:tetratricopeptide (TPR) repeat protein
MTMKRMWAGVLAIAVAGRAYAQGPILQPKLAELQPPKYSVPLCPLKPQGKALEKGVEMLRKSYDAKADKAAMLKQANDLILQSITAEAQAGNAAAWYYLARVYLQQGDVGGIDSAFAKALALQPQCELDINQYRQNNWAQLANAGLELQKKGDNEGAIVLFRDANRFFHGLPHVASNLGVLFANANKDDSAAKYFKEAYEIAEKSAATDTSMITDRNANAMNLILMYTRLGRHKEAIPMLHKYLAWDPKNLDARKMLIEAFRGANMADSAEALSNAMVSDMSKQNLDSLDLGDLMAIGVAAFNAQKYAEAATAFSKAAARNPYSRDAVYNLANAYLAMNDHQKLVETATKLVEIEPMNEDVYRLVGQGHKGLKHDAEVLKAAEKLVGLPFTVEMGSFSIGKSVAKLSGQATGRSPTDAQGKAIKPAPVTLVIEFVTSAGQVVDTKEVAIPVLQPGATQAIAVEAKGADIAGWRYHAK